MNCSSKKKNNTRIILTVMRGILPERPMDKSIISRGLDDNMWELMVDCWMMDPSQRPSAATVLERLNRLREQRNLILKQGGNNEILKGEGLSPGRAYFDSAGRWDAGLSSEVGSTFLH